MSDPIKAIYTSEDEIPESYRDLYEERGGSYHLTKIEGIKTDADVSRVQRALENEKRERSRLKSQWDDFFGDKSPDDVRGALDRLPELEEAAKGNVDEDKLNQLVETRLKTKLSPVERERDQAMKRLQETEQRIQEYETRERQRSIHDAVRQAAVKSKVLDTAQEDVLMLAERMFEVGEDGNVTVRDGVGVTPGVAPDVWLTEMQQKRPHWWPSSTGGGAKGSGSGGGFSNNPWTKDNWNSTRQGEVVRSLGMEKAEQMAKSAGSHVGATKPSAQ